MTGTSAISVVDLHKSFDRRTVRGGYTTFKTQLVQWLRPSRYREELARQRLKVLDGVNFEVRRGETLGIIGRNGAGKSTLLKLLTGIYKPTSGTIAKRGRISALLELGAGFHPEFSGRENIYMNGMILGLTRSEIRAREKQIIEFSEIGEFIDAPVRTYSSGMYMRLAFSIAVNVEPEILIIDEVLAVGDQHFQYKSKAKLDEFKRKDVAIILVTHDLGTVESWCNRALWLQDGRVAALGAAQDTVAAYRAAVDGGQGVSAASSHHRWGSRVGVLKSLRILDARGNETREITAGEALNFEVSLDLDAEPVRQPVLRLVFLDGHERCLFGTTTVVEGVALGPLSGPHLFTWRIPAINLVGRDVRVDVALETPAHDPIDNWTRVAAINVNAPRARDGIVHMPISGAMA